MRRLCRLHRQQAGAVLHLLSKRLRLPLRLRRGTAVRGTDATAVNNSRASFCHRNRFLTVSGQLACLLELARLRRRRRRVSGCRRGAVRRQSGGCLLCIWCRRRLTVAFMLLPPADAHPHCGMPLLAWLLLPLLPALLLCFCLGALCIAGRDGLIQMVARGPVRAVNLGDAPAGLLLRTATLADWSGRWTSQGRALSSRVCALH